MSEPRYFYVQDCPRYSTMDECVYIYGSGQLVADHRVLDEVSDLKAELEQAKENNKRLLGQVEDERRNRADLSEDLKQAKAEIARLKKCLK